MVDFYLRDDEDALFEHRWLSYSLMTKMKIARMLVSFITGIVIGGGIGINRPEVSLAALIGGVGGYKLFKKIKKKRF